MIMIAELAGAHAWETAQRKRPHATLTLKGSEADVSFFDDAVCNFSGEQLETEACGFLWLDHQFIRDADGNYQLRIYNGANERPIRCMLKQLGIEIVSEKFDDGFYRFKEEELGKADIKYTFVLGGRTVEFDLSVK
jgi:hypothetical protein